MFKKIAFALMLGLASAGAQAETFDLNISSDAVRAALSGPLRFGETNGARYDAGYLYTDDQDARLNVGHLGLMVSGDAGARSANVDVGIGLRAAAIDQRGADGGAVSVGGEFDVRLPALNRLGLVGYVFYAPEVLAFGDIDTYLDAALTIDYEIIRNASVYAGYRQVRAGVDKASGSDLRDNSPIVGLRLQF
ncbi:YfaZ family outer membrane protein [Algiphilus sp.]|uniref:YfaZ family outer membrane protein n=1 Tax=Algiphilus sp. TaxID=1872431 RepID=UPI001CA659E5|nr:YfaZ family outer membrane protein [Algiphilus sp.]MBY8965175.1 hypothetical protein [Algiphilus acroporae]MCI5063242.1 YfaZ family protein [Algiphilus sp.]MCI5104929.1 YfaZ family protein [Algiphilus sp.]